VSKAPNYYLVSYDIPSSRKRETRNPSDEFRSLGARLNMSSWLVPAENVPLLPLASMMTAGTKVRILKVHDDEKAEVSRMAEEELLAEIGSIRSALAASSSGISARYLGARAANDERTTKNAEMYHYSAIRRIEARISDVRKASSGFGILEKFSKELDILSKAAETVDQVARTKRRASRK
jgi:hypothetical protein